MEMNQKKTLNIFDYSSLIKESHSLRHGADLKIYKIKEPKKLLSIYKKVKYRYIIDKDFNPIIKNIHLLNLALSECSIEERSNIILSFLELTKYSQAQMDEIIEELFNLYDYFKKFQHVYIARFIRTLLLQIENSKSPDILINQLKIWTEYHQHLTIERDQNE